jgi:ABC-type lipoprotein export system ATPase subunit
MECIMTAKKAAGATLVVVTHNPELATGADRVMEMRDGNLLVVSVTSP